MGDSSYIKHHHISCLVNPKKILYLRVKIFTQSGAPMITLTKIDGSPLTVNADEIETVETSHDSTISLKSGRKIIVKETFDEIRNKTVKYRRECFSALLNQVVHNDKD